MSTQAWDLEYVPTLLFLGPLANKWSALSQRLSRDVEAKRRSGEKGGLPLLPAGEASALEGRTNTPSGYPTSATDKLCDLKQVALPL